MWYWEEISHIFKEENNILHTIKKRKANWIGHILQMSCLLEHVIEGKIEGRIEVTGRWGRRHKQLVDDCKEMRGYWKLKEETLDWTVDTHFGKGYGPVTRQITGYMSEMGREDSNSGLGRRQFLLLIWRSIPTEGNRMPSFLLPPPSKELKINHPPCLK